MPFCAAIICCKQQIKGTTQSFHRERNAEVCNYQLSLQPMIAFMCMIIICLGYAKGSLNQTPTDSTAMVGHYQAFFNCSTSKHPVENYAIWRFYALGAGEEHRTYIYDGGKITANYKGDFDIQINSSSGAFNLLVLQPHINYAGKYECSDDYDHAGASAELMILDSNWNCESNMDPEGVVGPTECDETLKPDKLNLSCSVICIGERFPEIDWRINGKSLTSLKSDCQKNDTKLTCDAVMEVSPHVEGSVFICQKGTQHCSHALNVSKVLYTFANTTKREYYRYTGDEVACVANTSRQLPCSYHWFQDNVLTEVSSQPALNPNDPGLYKCQARCKIRNHNCVFLAMEISVSKSGTGQNVYRVVSIIVGVVGGGLFFCCIGLLITVVKLRKKIRKQNKESRSRDMLLLREDVALVIPNGSSIQHGKQSNGQHNGSSPNHSNGSSMQNGTPSDGQRNGSSSYHSAAQPGISFTSTSALHKPSSGTTRMRGKRGTRGGSKST